MGCITFVLLVSNIIALVAIDIMFWAESAASGLAGVFGIITISYRICFECGSNDCSKRFLGNFAFGIFDKETCVANMTAFACGLSEN